jgi:NAD(P)-dependent dehydrogenase (short-subunit alcohol dehydrogenase family)
MRIILVGASGVVGSAVKALLGGRHEIVAAGRSGGDVQVDIADPASIRALFERAGSFDALVCTAGAVTYAPFPQLGEADYEVGLRSKLMGQVNLVTYGLAYIADGGSFTLTSGLTNDDPIREGTASSLVNGALEGYVRGAAIEMPRGVRINLVSPTLVEESAPLYGPYFPGTAAMPAREVALGYVKSVEGAQSGRVFRMGWSREAIS